MSVTSDRGRRSGTLEAVLKLCGAVLLLALASATTAWLARDHPRFDPDRACCDHLFYRAMADPVRYGRIPPGNRLVEVYDDPYFSRWMDRENGLERQPPYVFRPLTPFLARYFGFRHVTIVALTLAGWFLGLAAWSLTGRAWLGALAVVLFLGNPWIGPAHLQNDQLVDPLAFAFVSLGVLALVRGQRWLLLAIAAVGLFAKEPVAFLLPCWLWSLARRGGLRWWHVALAITACLPYAWFRLGLQIPVNTYSLETTFFRWRPHVLLAAAMATFGVLWISAIVGCWRSACPVLDLLPLVPLTFAAVYFAGNAERTLVYAYPFVILATCALALRIATAAWSRRTRVAGLAQADDG